MDDQALPTSESLRALGNEAIKNGKFTEAVLHYTHGIKLEPNNPALYSNRSLAYLKLKQYYLALKDANEVIKLNPAWVKGYFRKGEVEYSAEMYSEALISYAKALNLCPTDTTLKEILQKTESKLYSDEKADKFTPWLCLGLNFLIGTIILSVDHTLSSSSTNSIMAIFILILISLLGYCLGKFYRFHVKNRRANYLASPLDEPECDGEINENKSSQEKHRETRYTKSQARQRFKKGKM